MEMDDENDEEPPAPGTEEDGRSLLVCGATGLKVGAASPGHSVVGRRCLNAPPFCF